LALLLAGCGGGATSTQTHATSQPRPECVGAKSAAKRQRARRQLNADLRRLRAATATVHRYTQNGNDALNRALDRFMLHVAQPTLPVYERSRLIDRAAAIVAPRCYLCFQALEANRPIAAGAKLPCD
jgi:hypothetical protein